MAVLLNNSALKLLNFRGFDLKKFNYRNTPVYYLEGGKPKKGKKKPVVTIFPGYGDTVFSWTHLLIPLSKHAHVFAIDFPGYAGFSQAPKKGGTMLFDDYQEVADLFLKKIVGKTDLLIGNSLGGWLATRTALKNPTLVKHLIPVNTGGILTTPEEYLEIRNLFVIQSYFDFLKFMKKLWFKMPWLVYVYSLIGYFEIAKKPEYRETIFSIEGHHFINDDLKTTKLPITLIWGIHDKLFKKHMPEIFIKLAPHSTLQMFEKSGHMPQLEEPIRFYRILRQLLVRTAE